MEISLSLEQKKQKVKDFRPIDDVFFEVLANDREFCQEMLRVILEDNNLTVESVIVQNSERNLYGRSVRLDALCVLGGGAKVNVEMQRSDQDDHLRRVRFNASSITVRESQPGEHFENIPEVYVIYISEFDIFNRGKTIYHVDNTIRETGDSLDDGLHRIFVNTVCDDGTDIAGLMSCFTKTTVNNPKFPVFTRRMHELKEEEGGVTVMCEIMEKYEKMAADKATLQKGIEVYNTLLKRGMSKEEALAIANIPASEVNGKRS